MKKIVLFVEGDGDEIAMPHLISRLLTEQNAWDAIILDPNPFRVGQINKLLKDDYREWKRKLQACLKRPKVGGILLILDGDIKRVIGGGSFCAASVAQSLAEVAKTVGGGSIFSVASVFAVQEYESWLIAGVESFSGKTFPDERTVPSDIKPPDGNLEESPRGAKGWLHRAIEGGYKETRDQITLTQWLDLELVRNRGMRSFIRLESAVTELVTAIRDDRHIVSPLRPD